MAVKGRVIVGCTHGEEDTDRVLVAYLTAAAALDQGNQVVMWLTSEGVRLALRGYADRIRAGQEPPIDRVHAQFIDKGGLLRLPDLLQRARPRRQRLGGGRRAAGCQPAHGVRGQRGDDVQLLRSIDMKTVTGSRFRLIALASALVLLLGGGSAAALAPPGVLEYEPS